MKTNLRFDHQLLAVEGEHDVHCMLELHAPAAPDAARPPLHLALVIDRSGSMAGDKLDAARASATFLAGRLRPTDQLAIVIYDNDVDLVVPLGPAEPTKLAAAIAGIEPGGMTNLSGGWLKGLEELNRADGDATRRVLLLTDGLANEGIIDPDQLRQIAAGTKGRAATTTIGFGEGFDEDLLGAISACSDGNTYFVESPEDAPGVFTEEFDGLASLVAQNVSVEIRPTDAVEILGVLNDYPVTEVPGGLQIAIGDAYGDEIRRLVFALHVPQVAALGPAKVADVIVRYVAVGDVIAAHELTVPVTVNLVSADEAAVAGLDGEVTEVVWLLRAAPARRDAIAAADAGDHDRSSRIMRDASSALRAAPGSASMRVDEFMAEADLLDAEADASLAHDPTWRKRVTDQAWRRTRGRPTR
jgi:Ca-activated chloride channel family protein